MTLIERYRLGTNRVFLNRVRVACLDECEKILSESQDPLATPSEVEAWHIVRAFASRVALRRDSDLTDQIGLVIASKATDNTVDVIKEDDAAGDSRLKGQVRDVIGDLSNKHRPPVSV